MLFSALVSHSLSFLFLNYTGNTSILGLPRCLSGKESTCQCRRPGQVWSLGREDPWSRKWQPTPVCLSGKFHGQRNLAGYSPWKRVRYNLAPERRHTQPLGYPSSPSSTLPDDYFTTSLSSPVTKLQSSLVSLQPHSSSLTSLYGSQATFNPSTTFISSVLNIYPDSSHFSHLSCLMP